MLDKALLIVSDQFHQFATRKDVMTTTQLYHLLNTEDVILPNTRSIRLIPGQGFSHNTITNLLNLAKTAKNAAHFDFSLWYNLPQRASKELTHKHKTENILVSTPTRASDTEFNMSILIDENCEMMNDHQTGLHVQGMLLLEASRQGYLAIFEEYFFSSSQEKKYFIFNSLQVNYNRFAFPLPATLSVTIRKIDVRNSKKQHAIMDMEIIQCGNSAASFSLDMTMMADKRVTSMESKLANQSLNEHIDHIINHQEYNEVAHA
jgi:hypothetical protein